MKKTLFSLALFAMGSLEVSAENPLWLRNTAISPDGSTIAFTYKGHLYTVGANGGNARQLTQGSSYNTTPVWSPDGKLIAFSSNREGSEDIFVIDSNGGRPKRVTTHSGNEVPLSFADNNNIVFRASIAPDPKAANGAFFAQTYKVNVNGGRPELMTSLHMIAADIDKNGRVIYQDRKGVENIWRKHEKSSATGDIWLMDNGKFTKLTDFGGSDHNPVWGNADNYFYTSEEDGTFNVYSNSLQGDSKKQLTKFKKHPVRSLSASDNGVLAFSWDGEIYTLRPGEQPRKVSVNITTDDYIKEPAQRISRNNATDMAVSPDGETIAFILNGDVYLTSVEYATTRRVTFTPEQERTVSFAPDGRSIVYDSERNGLWQLFTSEIKDPNEKSMLYATELIEKPLYKGKKPAFQPVISPDGKKVAFLEDRTILNVLDIPSKKVTTALDGKYNYSYSDGDVDFCWSPDSRWLLATYIGEGGWNNTDIALVKADGTEVIDLTESGYADSAPAFAMDGKAVVWSTGRYGYKSHGSWGNETDAMAMFLDGEAWERFNMNEEELKLHDKAKKDEEEAKKKQDAKDSKNSKKGDKEVSADKKDAVKELKFDLDNRRYRRARLTGASSKMGAFFLSPKGNKFYYVATGPDGRSLFERDLKKGDTRTLVKGLSAWGMIPDKKGENLFVLTQGGMRKVNLLGGKVTPIEFEAECTNDPAATRKYIYDHMWRQVRDKFYDVNLHGVDWEFYRDAYAKFLPYIDNNYDFAILLSEILGELNASHTGGSYRAPQNASLTATLGAFYDVNHNGDGLRILEIIKRGPLDNGSGDVEEGDVILSINDSQIKAGSDYFSMLDGKAGKRVKLNVRKNDGSNKIVYVRPISAGDQSKLLYERWIERNEHIVDSVSGGRVGYVHIEGMNAPSFSNIYDRILGKYRNCDAIVVDTRHNGGGWLHNDVAVLLGGKEYVRYTPRGRYIGSDPFSQWTKPSVMLVDESNYSDAHGTPYVYQTLKIGDIVGAPIPGTMTAVWWENQVDPSIVFGIPQVTSQNPQTGKALENHQLTPDVIIYNKPENVLNGIDEQLIGATRHVMTKVKK